jgi:hypothetical protein
LFSGIIEKKCKRGAIKERRKLLINAEYIENGKRVIIPSEVWEALQDLAEHVEVYELAQARKDQPAVHSLDDLHAEEGLSRDKVEG